MYVELLNIRSWKGKHTFEFAEEGLVLLSGPSGAGKSSILNAINFALYGTGNKIITFGEKKGHVRFVFQGMDILRGKGPNRLTVNINGKEEQENDVAQEIINKVFGTNFTITSYITQKTAQSFLNLGPTEKMKLLEQIALKDDNIGDIKIKAKEYIKEYKDNLLKKVGQLEIINQEAEEVKKPEHIDFPLGSKHSDIKIRNEAKHWKKAKKDLETSILEEKTLKEEYSREQIQHALLKKQKEDKSQLDTKLENLSKEVEDVDFDGEENLVELKEALTYLKNKRLYTENQTRYIEERKNFEHLQEEELDSLDKELELLETKKIDLGYSSDCEEEIEVHESHISTYNKIKVIQDKLTSKRKSLKQYGNFKENTEKLSELEEKNKDLEEFINDSKQRVDIKCCPNCKTSLRINKTFLIVADGKPIDDSTKNKINENTKEIAKNKQTIEELKAELVLIKDIKKTIEKLETELEEIELVEGFDLEESQKEISRLKKLISLNNSITDEITALKNKIKSKTLSPTLKRLEAQLNSKKNDLDRLKKQLNDPIETEYTEEELREEISDQILAQEKSNSLATQIKDIEKQVGKCEVEISGITISDRDFDTEITDIKDKISALEVLNKKHIETDKKIQIYLEYKKKLEEYERWQNKIVELKNEEQKARRKLTVAETFLKKVREAESLAIAQTITMINHYMNTYLDKFFPDNPITVEICPYKETKKDIKPQININVGYKGLSSDLSSLSGGEYDRVTLSIVLALNTIFGSNILMLDESIASLDGDLANDILEVLKEILKNKLVIVVAHQINVGVFDSVVEC